MEGSLAVFISRLVVVDRVLGKYPVSARMGPATLFSPEEEQLLRHGQSRIFPLRNDNFMTSTTQLALDLNKQFKNHKPSFTTGLKKLNYFFPKTIFLALLGNPTEFSIVMNQHFFLNPKGNEVLYTKCDKTIYSIINSKEKKCLAVLISGNSDGAIVSPMMLFYYKLLPAEICRNIPSH
ncbi:hypothetical protein PR048_013998 [Dryococelus australis]|uniref:Uncharacterized protein n=1 Tax=Dryococelus australis TaxID=614101 RepID=A0ABQ9HU22_9NEOP|nr:hypothetical protein PR048_013998 [Dryococelus australis]